MWCSLNTTASRAEKKFVHFQKAYINFGIFNPYSCTLEGWMHQWPELPKTVINGTILEVKVVQERLALCPAPPAGPGVVVCKTTLSNASKMSSAHGKETLLTASLRCV
ncbi:hypothetical protein Q9233_004929 [Columba guinea]|nr:hypothetical protein Q9233_004929 [Columba guinea]